MPRLLCAVLLVLTAARAHAQTPRPALEFEVATIKPTDPNFGGILVGFPGGMFSARGFTLKDLVGLAYDVDNRQIVEVPKALESTRFDVQAKLPANAGPPNPDLIKPMLQKLLAERYQLTFRRETREMPVYVLSVARGGHKLKPRQEGDGGEPTSMLFRGATVPGRNVSIALFAGGLQKLVVDRPILDKTGLTGNWDFDLTWRPDAGQFGGRGAQLPADPDKPDIYTAIQEQMGLRLEAQRGPAPVLVIERAEPPTEN